MDGEIKRLSMTETGVLSIPGSAESVNVSRVFLSQSLAVRSDERVMIGNAIWKG
jgi:hypothetical protein